MAESLIDAFGIGHDLVAVVGAGGKTTLAFSIAREARDRGMSVIVTTTTRMGSDQDGGLPVVTTPDVAGVRSALAASGACLVVAGIDRHKALGVAPEWVDAVWRSAVADLIVVEADGARRRKVKVPAPHEPVVPGAATLLIAVMSAEAIGGVIDEVAHRPELVADLVGARRSDVLTVEGAAAVLSSPRGGMKSLPGGARFATAITAASGDTGSRARAVARLLAPIPAILLPGPPPRPVGYGAD